MTVKKDRFKFIDLFCGIWGFHIAFHGLWWKCIMACDNNIHARKTYEANFKKWSKNIFKEGLFYDDIRSINPEKIPEFDILCAWFPCQPFSQSWHKKGFADPGRGNLFFDIVNILKANGPAAFFLENVRHLENHDNWKTFKKIQEIIAKLWYSFAYKTVRASDFWLPQHRPRIFMVGFKKSSLKKWAPPFHFPEPTGTTMTMSDIFQWKCEKKIGYTLRVWWRGSWVHDRRNWDWYIVDGIERRLEVEEGKKMMGLPPTFEFPVSPAQAMKQLGNSVAVPAIKAVWESLIDYLRNHTTHGDNSN